MTVVAEGVLRICRPVVTGIKESVCEAGALVTSLAAGEVVAIVGAAKIAMLEEEEVKSTRFV